MKLFHQLEEKDKKNVINYFIQSIGQDMLTDNNIKIDALSEEDNVDKNEIEAALAHARTLPQEEQLTYLLNNNTCNELLFDFALTEANQTYYHSDDENVVFYESLNSASNKDESMLSTNGGAEDQINDEDIMESVDDLIKSNTFIDKTKLN